MLIKCTFKLIITNKITNNPCKLAIVIVIRMNYKLLFKNFDKMKSKDSYYNGKLKIMTLALFILLSADLSGQTWTFVSMPDFLNNDVRYPEPKWDGALDYVLDEIKKENPDFLLVAGDMVQGRWWQSRDQIKRRGKVYYSEWCQRMKDHDLKYYTAVGDHELGDNPWRNGGMQSKFNWCMKGEKEFQCPCADIDNVPLYEEMYVKYMKMPKNGPEGMKGLAYYFVHKNTLFIVVDVFEKEYMAEGVGTATVTGKQLEWVEETIKKYQNEVDHIIVMGHTPVIGPVRVASSSGLMLKDGQGSPFWQVMKKYHVDLYLCGEVHAVTCIEKDGVEQISHGGIFGYENIVNYMVVTVRPEKISLKIKAIKIEFDGDKLYQTYLNHPHEYLSISKKTKKKGYQVVGKMTIEKSGGTKQFIDKRGIFIEEDDPKTQVVEGNPKTVEEGYAQGNKILERYLK